ncbi:MAG TPA: hypothetical protein VLX92_26175 [Kofleriaceae bacterium]|nr:hypothetical protein [Kofleriaceae bacterium]
MRPSRVAPLAVLAGCIYYPDSWHAPNGDAFAGKHVASQCLDLSLALTDDRDGRGGPAVDFWFGNRCKYSVIVDLTSVRAYGRDTDNESHELQPVDPKHEIRPLPLDGLWHGREEIVYGNAAAEVPAVVCLDVGRVDRAASPTVHWICLGAADEGCGS